MPSKATWRIYYTFYFVVWWRKNWENVDAKKMLKYSLLLKHYLLLNETWMTDFSWQTCLACQVLNVGYEKCKMLLRFQVYWFLYTFAKLLTIRNSFGLYWYHFWFNLFIQNGLSLRTQACSSYFHAIIVNGPVSSIFVHVILLLIMLYIHVPKHAFSFAGQRSVLVTLFSSAAMSCTRRSF